MKTFFFYENRSSSTCSIYHICIDKVFAVDVGYGQLDWKLQTDSRVVSLDRKNARDLSLTDIKELVDLVVIDASFISLRIIIPPAINLLKSEGDLIALVKPQFEVGKEQVENKGIIKNPKKHLEVLIRLNSFMKKTFLWAFVRIKDNLLLIC